ncbi:hypothetical protein Tco_1385501 [Tanacetum coccineum]
MRSPSTHLDDGTSKSKPLLEGTNTDPKDLGSSKQLTNRDHTLTLGTDQSRANTEYYIDKTQTTQFEVSDPDHHKVKTSSEVELDTDTMILTTIADIQALLGDSEDELKDENDDESPSLKKDDREPSHAKKSADASDSESSSCFDTFKHFDNYMPITERQLVRNLQNISEVHYAQVVEDNWAKHEEVAASYAN